MGCTRNKLEHDRCKTKSHQKLDSLLYVGTITVSEASEEEEYENIHQMIEDKAREITCTLDNNSRIMTSPKIKSFLEHMKNYRVRNNRFKRGWLWNNIDRWFQVRGQDMQRNSPKVRHYIYAICSVSGHYEQHHHIAVYQFQDLATLSAVITLPQTNITTNNAWGNIHYP